MLQEILCYAYWLVTLSYWPLIVRHLPLKLINGSKQKVHQARCNIFRGKSTVQTPPFAFCVYLKGGT